MSLSNSHNDLSEVSAVKKPRRLWRIILYVLIGFALILAVLWSQRLSIIETSTRSSLEKEKIDADFSIVRLTSKDAVIDDIRLMRGGEVFFSAQRLILSYDWRKARDLEFEKIDVKSPVLYAKIDQSGKVISDWMPQSNAGGQTSDFAVKDLFISGGQLFLQSPYGDIETRIDADIESLASGQVELKIEPTTLEYEGAQIQIAGTIEASLNDQTVDLDLGLAMPGLAYSGLAVESAALKGPISLTFGEDIKAAESDVRLNFERASFQDLTFGAGDVSWKGRAAQDMSGGMPPSISGQWSADLQDAAVSDPARRLRLAKSITLHETLSAISSLAPFAPDLTQNLDEFLRGSDFRAAGGVDISEAGRRLSLNESAVIEKTSSAGETVTIEPRNGDEPIYQFDTVSKSISVRFNGALDGERALSLDNAVLTAQSSAGQSLSNLQAFTASVQTHNAWTAQTPNGKLARLAPFAAEIDYRAKGGRRDIKMNGGIEFDGDVPGGYVSGAKAKGLLSLSLKGGENITNFRPEPGQPISIDRFETVTDWVFEELVFGLKPFGPQLYKRGDDTREIKAEISAAKGRLIHNLSKKDMTFDFDRSMVSGALTDLRQNWQMQLENGHMTSDSFPSPGTDIFARAASLTAVIEPDKPVTFNIESPNADIKTQLISAKNMKVSAAGTPEDMRVDYSQGLVKFSAGELPVLPLTGNANYDGAIWTGSAQTKLPRAETTPIKITYDFSDGVGTADVRFEDLEFTPRGLQPKHLASAFAGKISRVDGRVSSDIHLSFGADQPLQSYGTVTISDMQAATLPGPLSGINSVLKFSSFFPLQTDGAQTLTLGGFDPGFPLTGGDVTFEVVPDGIKLTEARWPLGGGFVTLEPTTWRYSAAQNRVVLAVEDVELGEFFKDMAGGKFSATGRVNGRLPVVIEGVKVNVENGRLAVEDGGVIQYRSAETDAAGDANAYAGYAFDALKNFEYQEMAAEINGPLDGEMKLRMKFAGSNPDVLYGSKFLFNVGVEGELLNIARSFQTGGAIQQSIVDQIKKSTPTQ